MNRIHLFLIPICYICCFCSHKQLAVDSFDNDLVIQAQAIEDESLEKSHGLRISKAKKFLEENNDKIMRVSAMSWASNRIYFDALAKILFYTKEERFNTTLEVLYWELQKRNFAKESDRETVFSYYSRDRQFGEASSFLSKLPDWQTKEFRKPPRLNTKIVNEHEAKFLKVKSKDSLEVAPFSASYSGLVIIGSPYCHFTANALKDIIKNKREFPALKKNVLLLVPQESIELEDVLSWNNRHADLPYHLVYRERAFKNFSFASLPTFYFLKDGKIISEFSGWPKVGRLADLEDGFKAMDMQNRK